jgi:hypothetical protein
MQALSGVQGPQKSEGQGWDIRTLCVILERHVTTCPKGDLYGTAAWLAGTGEASYLVKG